MTVNPGGYQLVGDGGIPQTFTGKAGGTISGGQFLKTVSGTSFAVGSMVADFATSDLPLVVGGSGANFIGIALHDATSGTDSLITFLTKGLVIVATQDDMDPAASNSVAATNADSVTDSTASDVIGRIWTSAASGGFVLLKLDV